MLVILEEKWANGQVYVVKNTRKWAKKSFLCVLLVDQAESDREKHSVFFGQAESDREKHSVFLGTHPTHSRQDRSFPTTTRVLFTGQHRQSGRCSGLGRAVCGGACK